MADSNQFDALQKVGSEIPDDLLRDEPQPPPVVSKPAPAPPAKTRTTYDVTDHPDGEDDNEQKRKQLATVGAIAAAGIAIFLGVRHFRGDEKVEVETAGQKAKRKAKEAEKAAEHAAETAYDRLGSTADNVDHNTGGVLGKTKDAADSAFAKSKEAASDAYSRASHAASKAEDKAEHLAHLTKQEIEEEVEEADAAAASPENELEARRMAYGQDKHGVPKGPPAEDNGFLGLNKVFSNLPWNKK